MEMENAESLKMSSERRLRCGHLFVEVNAKSPQNCAISTDLTLLRLALEPKEVDQTLHHCHRWRLDLWRLQRASKRRGRELRVNRREQRANPSRAIVKGGGGGFWKGETRGAEEGGGFSKTIYCRFQSWLYIALLILALTNFRWLTCFWKTLSRRDEIKIL